MTKTMVLTDDVWQELMKLKIDSKKRSLNEVLKELFLKIKKE